MVTDFITKFNEDDLLHLIVATELYIKEHQDCGKKIIESQNKFTKIWYQLKTNEDYMIYGEPF